MQKGPRKATRLSKRSAALTYLAQFHGGGSLIWLCLWPLTMALSLQVSVKDAMPPRFAAPAS